MIPSEGRGAVEAFLHQPGENTKTFIFTSKKVRVVENQIYVNLRSDCPTVRRIITMLVPKESKDCKRLYKITSRTDIIEQIAKSKDEAINTIIAGNKVSSAKRFRRTVKMYTENRLTMGESVDVETPAVGDVEPISVKALAKQGLWVELKSETLLYLAKAVAAQLEMGGVNRKPTKRGRKGQADPDEQTNGCDVDDGAEDAEEEHSESDAMTDASHDDERVEEQALECPTPVRESAQAGGNQPTPTEKPVRPTTLDHFFKRVPMVVPQS